MTMRRTFSNNNYYLLSLFLLVSLLILPIQKCIASKALYLYLTDQPENVDPIIDYESPTHPLDPNRPPAAPAVPSKPEFLYGVNQGNRIVEFYAPWCGHCQHFKPRYVQFGRTLKSVTKSLPEAQQITIYAVSCDANRNICKDQKIRSYPALFIFPAGSTTGTMIYQSDLQPSKILKHFGIELPTISTQKQQQQQQTQYISTKPSSFRKPPDNLSSSSVVSQQSNLRVTGTTTATTTSNNDNIQVTFSSHDSYFGTRTKQEIYNDAYLSFDFLMRNVEIVVDNDSSSSISKQKRALRDFLQLLQKTIPQSSFQMLIRQIQKQIDKFSQFDEYIVPILDKYPPTKQEWSPACKQHGTGYTCGLWTLFHIMTVGAVEWNASSQAKKNEQLISPRFAAESIANVIGEFFQCNECRNNFLKEFHACQRPHCLSLISKPGEFQNWIQLPLWLYEAHNGVNVRLYKERYAKEHGVGASNQVIMPTAAEQLAKVQWPPIEECPMCWKDDTPSSITADNSSWDDLMVYRYLRVTYWPDDEETDHYKLLLLDGPFYKNTNNLPLSTGVVGLLIQFGLAFTFFLLVVCFVGKRNRWLHTKKRVS